MVTIDVYLNTEVNGKKHFTFKGEDVKLEWIGDNNSLLTIFLDGSRDEVYHFPLSLILSVREKVTDTVTEVESD